MKSPLYVLPVTLIGAVVAMSPSALAVDVPPKTLAQCAQLLPAGQSYTYRLDGTIDMTTGKPVLSGTFSVGDGTTVDRHKESEAFGKCVAALMGA